MTNIEQHARVSKDRLHELFDYSPETGTFTRKVACGRIPAGSEFGNLNSNGYLQGTIDRKNYLLHRLAWLYVHGEWPGVVDHVNGNRADNRLSNLRNTTQAGNIQNLTKSLGASEFPGVSWDSIRGMWRAHITDNGKYWNLGRFESEVEARAAYLGAKKVLHAYWAKEVAA